RVALHSFAEVEDDIGFALAQLVDCGADIADRLQRGVEQRGDLASDVGDFLLADALDLVQMGLERRIIVVGDYDAHALHLCVALSTTAPIRSSYFQPIRVARMIRSPVTGFMPGS